MYIENSVSKPVLTNQSPLNVRRHVLKTVMIQLQRNHQMHIENLVSKPVCDNSESPECKKTCTENNDDSVAKEPSNAFIENLILKSVCDKSKSPECKKTYTHTEIHSLKIWFLSQFVTNQSPLNVRRHAENSNDSVAKEPSNAFIENPVSKPVCDNSESPECLEHRTEINNKQDPDREENSTVINTDEVNATEVTNEIGNENIKQSNEEQKSHNLVNLLCNDKNGNLEQKEVNFQMSDNNVQQNDAREVIISITSSEEDREQSRISMSVDDIINLLERSESIDKCLDGDDIKNKSVRIIRLLKVS